jgi:integrase/recombinase XerC
MSMYLLTARFYQAQSLSESHLLTVNDSLEDHLKAFILHCKMERLSESTIRNYVYYIGSFVVFAEKNNVTRLCDINKMAIQLFLIELGKTNNGTSCRDYYKCIKRFFNWLLWEDIITVSPMAKIELPKADTKIIQPFTSDQINKMLACCNTKYEIGLRDKVIILVFYETAARLKEIAGMRVEDVDINEGTVKVFGKGNKERLVPVSTKTMKLLYQYTKTRKFKSDWLWIKHDNGQQITRDGKEQMIQGLKAKTGITGVRLSPHTFRHTRATQLLKDGVQQKFVQRLLGDTDPRILNKYLDSIDNEQALKAIREKDLGGKIDN